jgi:hypothetical protein
MVDQMGLEDRNQDAWAEYSNRSTPFSPEEREALSARRVDDLRVVDEPGREMT